MLGKYAAAYLVVVEAIEKLVSNLEKIPPAQPGGGHQGLVHALLGTEPRLDKPIGDNIKAVVESIVTSMGKRMALPSVSAQGRRIQHAVDRGGGPKEIGDLLKELRIRFFDELNEREFLYVSPERVRFYKEPMLFGKGVNDRFPLAIDDIEEAGKCLAVGQGTACVLHTMRVMEVGLKALGKALNIPYAPSWEAYLTQISANIAKKHKNKTATWKRDEKFYRDLSGDLLIAKQAWRNPTMHVDRKYSAEEAEQIFVASKNFMARLAEHFTQKEMEKLLK